MPELSPERRSECQSPTVVAGLVTHPLLVAFSHPCPISPSPTGIPSTNHVHLITDLASSPGETQIKAITHQGMWKLTKIHWTNSYPAIPVIDNSPLGRISKHDLYPDLNFSLPLLKSVSSPLTSTNVRHANDRFLLPYFSVAQSFTSLAICFRDIPWLWHWLFCSTDSYNGVLILLLCTADLTYHMFISTRVPPPSGQWELMPQGRHSRKPIYIKTQTLDIQPKCGHRADSS